MTLTQNHLEFLSLKGDCTGYTYQNATLLEFGNHMPLLNLFRKLRFYFEHVNSIFRLSDDGEEDPRLMLASLKRKLTKMEEKIAK